MPLPVAWQISVLALQPLAVPGSQVTQAPFRHMPAAQSALTVQAGTHWPPTHLPLGQSPSTVHAAVGRQTPMPLPVAWQVSVLASQPWLFRGLQVAQAPLARQIPEAQSALTVQPGTHWPLIHLLSLGQSAFTVH